MLTAIIITIAYCSTIWLIFFKFKLMRFNIVWGIVSFWIGIHLLLIFIIGMRFSAPFTVDAHIIRNTIQIVPRLQGPTILEEVLVTANQPVKKGTPLYQFDDTIYKAKVEEAQAQLIAAQQNAKILQANLDAAQNQQKQAEAQLEFALAQQKRFAALTPQGGARGEDLDKWNAQVAGDQAQVDAAKANVAKATLAIQSTMSDGTNTTVAEAQAQLDQAQYYLEQTTVRAPADGFITNQQAQPGLVVGDLRVGAIAVFITEEPAYMLGSFFQEHIKFVEPGQPVEVALDIAPGEIFTGKVKAVWWATSQGQIRPTGRIPQFVLPRLQGKFGVEITFDDPDAFLPTGGHGAVAIYTGRSEGFELLRRINMRIYSFSNFVYPFNL